MPLTSNQQLFEYRIVRVLGQGAFGIVYLAHDTLLDRRVAIKELTVTAQTDEVAFKRFIQEARTAGNLNHPHIVTVYALKVMEPEVYLVMEYLPNGSLRTLLEKRSPLPLEEAVRIAADVCEGLAAAHAKGIVHRDVKPENVLLAEDGRAKIGDFGIARVPQAMGGYTMTRTGFQPGTLLYMSPEQVRGQRVDERSDVYGVGVVLYEMLTGRHYVDVEALGQQAREIAGSNVMLFQARLYELLAEAVCERQPEGVCEVLPDVPEWVGGLVAAALGKEVEERPTAANLTQALRERDIAQVMSAERYPSHSEAYAQQPHLNVRRAFASTQRLDVLGRPRLKSGDEWQELGRTPGKVTIPPNYDLGIRPLRGFPGQNVDKLAILVQELADFGPVQWLDLSSNRRITDVGLAHLKALTGLTSLNLAGCERITDAGLAHLKALTNLTSLSLGQLDPPTQITDAGLTYLCSLTRLTSLNLWWCKQITDAGLAHLKALPRLTSLNLVGCEQITDAGLAHLKALTSLTNLSLAGCWRITDVGLAHLKALPGLASLSLGQIYLPTQITDAGLAHLKALTSLTSLNLAGCTQITDTGLAHLKALTRLTSLRLWYCKQITDAGLAYLKALTGLTSLNLRECEQVTDAGLAHLKALPGLTSLNLSWCEQITDAGLAHLKALLSLTSLELWGCKQITDAGLALLERPELDIEIEGVGWGGRD